MSLVMKTIPYYPPPPPAWPPVLLFDFVTLILYSPNLSVAHTETWPRVDVNQGGRDPMSWEGRTMISPVLG